MIWKKFNKMTKYTIVKNYVRLKGGVAGTSP